MSIPRPPATDREEPPFVLALLMSAVSRTEDIIRRGISSLNRRLQLFLWGAGTLATFGAVLTLSVAESPGLLGVARGIGAGLFLALLFAVGVGWMLLWANSARPKTAAPDTPVVGRLDSLLAPTLRELNAVRAEIIRKVKERSVTRVPLGVAAGFGFWLLSQSNDDPPGFFGLIGFLIGGALGGEIWAAAKLERDYRRLYKNRVLPQLAARFGDLTYREAAHDDIQKLRAHRILEFDKIHADDEIAGTHRGLSVEIVEARLEKRSGDETQEVFDGLLIEFALPRSLTGTTVVLTDEGAIGNLKARWRSAAMQPVRLEDPRFEERFEVYSNDQIEARALLTPAFMERFMALAAGSGFSLPGALAEGNHLTIALPKRMGVADLFEPPVYWKPAGGRALMALEEDIRNVLAMADTVIDLDFWAAGRKRDSMGAM